MAEFRENKDVGRPFLSTPDDRVYFPASIVEKARRDALRCLKRGEGVALVLGDAGVGKTLLSRVVAASFGDDDLVAVVSASRKLSVKAFLQQLLYSLHQTFVGGDETELRLMTLDFLARAPQKRRILLVDDAQNLTLRVFDEIGMLIDRAESPAQFSVALFGSPALENRLNMPRLYPFAQRVVARAWLEAFTAEETSRFITRELKRAGIDAKFAKAARKAVAELSEGSPRVVVQLCDRALFFATENAPKPKEGEKPRSVEVDEEGVRAAWRDLLSIADDPSEKTKREGADDVVEFGELDDDDSSDYDDGAPRSAANENEAEPQKESKESEPARPVAQVAEQPEPPKKADEANAPQKETTSVETVEAREENAPVSYVHDGTDMPTISTAASSEDAAKASAPDPLAEARRRAAEAFRERESRSGAQGAPLEANDDEPGEIDESLDARLRAKLDAAEANGFKSSVAETKVEPMNFELVTEDGKSYKTTSPGLDGVSNARRSSTPGLWDKGGGFDEALQLDSAYPPSYNARKSLTRKPIDGEDDGSGTFRDANGFNADDSALFSAEDSHLEEQLGKASNEAGRPSWNESDAELRRSLEDRAYRQIVASCYRSSSDFPSSEQYLKELRLLEQEIAEEANLIRRIRSIHLQLRAVRERDPQDASRENGSRNLPGSITTN